jgi:dolichyl-phosphate beta-glucosyltransferase
MSFETFEAWRKHEVTTPELSVVIPCFNEAERILPTLAAMAVHISELGIEWELLVSDDGSSDGTADLVEALGWKNLHVLRHANTGKGGAVRRGVLEARGEMILFADADNSTPIEELPRLMVTLNEGFDVVIGSRAADGAEEHDRSLKRQITSGVLRGVVRLSSGIQVKDTQCGFKLFRRNAARTLFGAQRTMKFTFDLEILYLARKFGFSVAEVPVQWFDAPGSKVNAVRDGLRFLRDIRRIVRDDRAGLYDSKELANSSGDD